MSLGGQPERHVADIVEKLDVGVALDVDDVKFILSFMDWRSDNAPLDEYKEAIDEAITGDLGHAVYRSILEEFEREDVIDELRDDLIDPSLEADVQRFYGDGSERIPVFLHAPNKMPGRLNRIRWAIYDYLFCTGYGFHFDAEMIYSIADDYRAFLRNVITCTHGLDTSQLRVDVDGSTVTIRILTNEFTYYRVFEQGKDFVHLDAVDPIVHALAKEGSETLLYSTEYLLVVEQEHKDLVKRYTSTDLDGEEEYQKKIRNRIYNYLYFGAADSLDRVMEDLKTHPLGWWRRCSRRTSNRGARNSGSTT